jgi:hypothetical protein
VRISCTTLPKAWQASFRRTCRCLTMIVRVWHHDADQQQISFLYNSVTIATRVASLASKSGQQVMCVCPQRDLVHGQRNTCTGSDFDITWAFQWSFALQDPHANRRTRAAVPRAYSCSATADVDTGARARWYRTRALKYTKRTLSKTAFDVKCWLHDLRTRVGIYNTGNGREVN